MFEEFDVRHLISNPKANPYQRNQYSMALIYYFFVCKHFTTEMCRSTRKEIFTKRKLQDKRKTKLLHP